MRNAIPMFSTTIRALFMFMKLVYTKSYSRKTIIIARVILCNIGWSNTKSDAFCHSKSVFVNKTTLFHQNNDRLIFVYTIGFDQLWFGMVTKVSIADPPIPQTVQRHQLNCFLSGSFCRSLFGWFTLEEEVLAIVNYQKSAMASGYSRQIRAFYRPLQPDIQLFAVHRQCQSVAFVLAKGTTLDRSPQRL